jgi:hypothetical protein
MYPPPLHAKTPSHACDNTCAVSGPVATKLAAGVSQRESSWILGTTFLENVAMT